MRSITLLSLGALACSDYVIDKIGETVPGGEVDTGTLEAPVDESDDPPVREDRPPRDTAVPEEPTDEPEEDPEEEPPEVEIPTEPVYLHTGNTLYSWDPDTGLLSLIGDFHAADGAAPHGDATRH